MTTRNGGLGTGGSVDYSASESLTMQDYLFESDYYSPFDLGGQPQSTTAVQPVTFNAVATGTGTASASPGSLHANATATYQLTPYTATAEWIGAEGTPTAGQPDATGDINPFAVTAAAGAVTEFQDTFTVLSSTLPVGTLVDLQFTAAIDATLQAGSELVAGDGIENEDGRNWAFFPFLDTTDAGTIGQAVTRTRQVEVGGTFVFFRWIDASANAPSGNCDPGSYGPYDLCGSQTVVTDASDTGNFYLDPLDSGVSLQFDSGHDYSTPTVNPVPEPAIYAMMLSGLGLLGFRRRRDKAGSVL